MKTSTIVVIVIVVLILAYFISKPKALSFAQLVQMGKGDVLSPVLTEGTPCKGIAYDKSSNATNIQGLWSVAQNKCLSISQYNLFKLPQSINGFGVPNNVTDGTMQFIVI